MTLLVDQIKAALEDKAIPEKAAFFPRFFKAVIRSTFSLFFLGK